MISPWTRLQIRTYVREELQDTTGRWWSDPALNDLIDDWHNDLNGEFEVAWAISTSTATASVITTEPSVITLPTNAIRFGRIYCDDLYLPRINRERLVEVSKAWMYAYRNKPFVWYQDDFGYAKVWPTPYTTCVYVQEFPTKAAFTNDNTQHMLPGWMNYSAINAVCAQAYTILSPNHDPVRAARYKAKFGRQTAKFRRYIRNYFPTNYPALKPGGVAEFGLTDLHGAEGYYMPTIYTSRAGLERATVTGTVDGSNTVFTLNKTGTDYMVSVNGIELNTSEWSVVGSTLTFLLAAPPPSAEIIVWVSNPS